VYVKGTVENRKESVDTTYQETEINLDFRKRRKECNENSNTITVLMICIFVIYYENNINNE
jgi:hypothetical protein